MATSFPNSGRKIAGALALTALLVATGPLAAQPAAKRDETTIRFINETLAKGWREQRLTPSPKIADHQFLRRASLDVIGRIPTVEEIRTFEQDRRPDRRARLIERLLDSPDYARHWAGTWTDWLVGGSEHDPERDRPLEAWLRQQFSLNISHKSLAEKLLTATGKASDNPAVLYVMAHLGRPFPAKQWREDGQFDAVPLTRHAGRLFLGVRLNCVRCHDHPQTAEWQQPHFWGVNAFFRQIELRRDKGKLELTDNPALNAEGLVLYERLNGLIQYRRVVFLNGEKMPARAPNRREALAKFVTAHPSFAKAFVNHLWACFFGRGLSEKREPDDFGEHNPAIHPELLDRLARAFVDAGHDPKALIRWLCNSDAYQLQSAVNPMPDEERYFSLMPRKALSARQRLESVLTALGADETLTAGERTRLREQWLALCDIPEVGDERDHDICTHPHAPEPAVEMAWMMANSREIEAALVSSVGPLAEAMKADTPARTLEALYLTAYGRRPTEREAERLLKARAAERGRSAWWQDLYFVMLNSSEFVLNH